MAFYTISKLSYRVPFRKPFVQTEGFTYPLVRAVCAADRPNGAGGDRAAVLKLFPAFWSGAEHPSTTGALPAVRRRDRPPRRVRPRPGLITPIPLLSANGACRWRCGLIPFRYGEPNSPSDRQRKDPRPRCRRPKPSPTNFKR